LVVKPFAYDVRPYSCRYFVALEILTTVFFANLVIAVSYRSYKEYASHKLISRLQKRQRSLRRAFTLLLSTHPGKSLKQSPDDAEPVDPSSPESILYSDQENGLADLDRRSARDDAFMENFFRAGIDDATDSDSEDSQSTEYESDDGEDGELSLAQWLLLFLFERKEKRIARIVGSEIYHSVRHSLQGASKLRHSFCIHGLFGVKVLEQSIDQKVTFPEFCQLCSLYEIKIHRQRSLKRSVEALRICLLCRNACAQV